jgi:hypothetical protein
MIGALIIQTLTYTIYSLGVPPEVNMVVKSVVVFLVCLSQSAEFRQAGAVLFRAEDGMSAPQVMRMRAAVRRAVFHLAGHGGACCWPCWAGGWPIPASCRSR